MVASATDALQGGCDITGTADLKNQIDRSNVDTHFE